MNPAFNQTVGLNAELWRQHRDNVDVVMGHAVFSNARIMAALGVNKSGYQDAQCGFQAVYDYAAAKAGADHLSKTKQYACSVNSLWATPSYTTAAGNVPIVWNTVRSWETTFSGGGSGHAKQWLGYWCDTL